MEQSFMTTAQYIWSNPNLRADPSAPLLDDIAIAVESFENAFGPVDLTQTGDVVSLVDDFLSDGHDELKVMKNEGTLAFEPVTLTLGLAALLLLQTEFSFEIESNGKWKCKIVKKAMPADSAVKLFSYLKSLL